ncbi:kinectin [Trichonephila clavipes]|nr:kinectin [Trichonephila clavipes]
MHHLARERIGMASEKMKTRYDARATRHDFHEGDKLWLWNPKSRKGRSPKLQTNWEGPYTVLKRLNDVVVRIEESPYSKPKKDPGTSCILPATTDIRAMWSSPELNSVLCIILHMATEDEAHA